MLKFLKDFFHLMNFCHSEIFCLFKVILIHIVHNSWNNWYLTIKMLHQARLGIWHQQVICKTSDTILVSLGRMLTLDIILKKE